MGEKSVYALAIGQVVKHGIDRHPSPIETRSATLVQLVAVDNVE